MNDPAKRDAGGRPSLRQRLLAALFALGFIVLLFSGAYMLV